MKSLRPQQSFFLKVGNGFTNVLQFEGGLEEWKAAGFGVEKVG